MTLTVVEAKVMTLMPDDSVFKTYTISGGSWAHAENRIGEKKRLQIEYNSDVDITGHNFYINTALFMREDGNIYYTGKGTVHYFCNIADATAGNVYNAVLSTTLTMAGFDIISNRNFTVRVLTNGTTNFKIQVDFFMIADTSDNYMRFNHDKGINTLTTDANAPGIILDATNSNIGLLPKYSVYAQDSPPLPFSPIIRSPRVYIYAEKPGSFPLISTSKEFKFMGFKAGFYNQNAWQTAPWFTQTGFVLKRGGNVVTDLSTNMDTDVEIYATSGDAANHVTKFVVWIMRMSQFSYYNDFYTNLDAEFQVIELANVSTTKIKAPMTDPTNTSGNIWKGTFKVGPLPLTDTYRFVGIAYSDNVGYKVNSFISPQYSVVFGVKGPEFNGEGFSVRAALDDYNRQFEGNNLECAIEERMRSKIKFEFPFNQWKNDILARLGLVVGNDIRRYLTRIDVLIYEEYTDPNFGNIKNFVDFKTSNKVGTSSYSPQSGLTMLFSNSWAEFIYEWRNRFESNIPCVATAVNGISVNPVLGNQYWGGKTLKIKWTWTFTYDNYTIPFSENIEATQQIRVKDYGEMAVKYVDEDESDYGDVEYVCNDDQEVCFAGVLQNPSLPDRKLIANIYPTGSTVNNVEESENWVGNQLPQLGTNKIPITSEDYQELYSETAARFCIDVTKLVVNSQYTISAMAKKFVDTGFRITEVDGPRITENNDRRTIDNL